jgi:miniconductance mechanosensitive channel
MKTVKFCSADMINRFKKIRLLKDYIARKEAELVKHNQQKEGESLPESLANGRRLTNIGVFRVYLEEYIKEHPMINEKMTFMVRQLNQQKEGNLSRFMPLVKTRNGLTMRPFNRIYLIMF